MRKLTKTTIYLWRNQHKAPKVDLGCREVWEAQMEALFDASVVFTDDPSFANISSDKVLENA